MRKNGGFLLKPRVREKFDSLEQCTHQVIHLFESAVQFHLFASMSLRKTSRLCCTKLSHRYLRKSKRNVISVTSITDASDINYISL